MSTDSPSPPTDLPPEDPQAASDRFLQDYLADRDEPCPRCGYNLRGLQSARCPECGDPLRLKVGLVEPRLAPYIATLVALCFGCGGSLLFIVLALLEAPTNWWFDQLAGLFLIVELLVCGVAAILLLVFRRWFTARTKSTQILLASASWATMLTLSAGVLLFFDS